MTVRWKRQLTSRGVQRLGERERTVGIDPEDEAARWLEEHEPEPVREPPRSASKSKHLHRWRLRQARGGKQH